MWYFCVSFFGEGVFGLGSDIISYNNIPYTDRAGEMARMDGSGMAGNAWKGKGMVWEGKAGVHRRFTRGQIIRSIRFFVYHLFFPLFFSLDNFCLRISRSIDISSFPSTSHGRRSSLAFP